MPEEYTEPVLTRREALQGGSAAAVAVGAGLLSETLIGRAAAQTTEPRIQLGDDYTIHDDGSNLVISHGTNGDVLTYDPSADAWIPAAPIGNGANRVDVTGDGFDANSILLSDGMTVNQIEFGTEMNQLPGAASDDGWDTAEVVTDSVTFSTEFDSPPSVASNFRSRGGIVLSLFDVTTTGFSMAIRNYSTTDHSSRTDPWYWVAIG